MKESLDKPLLDFVFRVPEERLRDFKDIPDEDKLRWLEEARDFVAKMVPPEKLALWRKAVGRSPNG